MLQKSLVLALTLGTGALASAQVTLSAMTTFGGGDGWLAPSEFADFSIDRTRGMAFNKATGNLIYARSAGGTGTLAVTSDVRVLNGTTGASLGSMNLTGVAGGANAVNKVGISDDGQVFVSNLTTSVSPTATTNTYNIYRFSSENFISGPTLAFQGTPGTAANGTRLGDSFDIFGSGMAVSAVAGFGSVVATSTLASVTAGVARFNGLGVGGTVTAAIQTFTGASSGVARLGLTFIDADSYLGSQGGSTTASRILDTTSGSSNFVTLTTTTERGFDVMILDGIRYLATIDTQGSVAATVTTGTGSVVRIYQMTGSTATLITSANLTSGTQPANVNGTGDIKFGNFAGAITGGYNGTLYAMNTNSGIQAYNVNIVPEPATMTALGLGIAAMLRRRKSAK